MNQQWIRELTTFLAQEIVHVQVYGADITPLLTRLCTRQQYLSAQQASHLGQPLRYTSHKAVHTG